MKGTGARGPIGPAGTAMRAARRMLAAALALAVCACATRDGALVPIGAAPPTVSTVDMLTATTRAPSDQQGVVFSGERGELSFANTVVSIPPRRPVGSIQWPRQIPADPSREFALISMQPLSRPEIAPWFRKNAHGHRRVLVFVHGFNTRFDASVFRFAQFVNDTDASLVPVLFSWPSRGRVLDYVYDRESANFSRSDLAYVLEAAARSPQVDEVVVLAHSMGAWLTVEALRQLALTEGRVPAKISNVILASPDLDIDVFGRQVAEMGEQRPLITIFTSRNDRALGLSRIIAGSVTRVGQVDLTQDAYRERLERTRGIVVLDLTAIEGGDSLNHSKFATSPQMVQLLGKGLMETPSMDGDNAGVEAAQALGSAVGTVVAAPILLFSAGLKQ